MSLRRSLIPFVLFASAAAAALSCADSSPAGVGLEMSPLLGKAKALSDGDALVACTPLGYDSVTQVIGPAGGYLVVGGSHLLIVDPLALSGPVAITAVVPSATVNLVRFRPEGLVFQPGVNGRGAFLATSLDNCKVRRNDVLRIAHVSDDSLKVMSYLAGPTATDSLVVQALKKDVELWGTGGWVLWAGGQLNHFSNYAVAW